ncbi:MAG: hypothetical protein C3F02_02115 [Parcubacteria group bacterium]|nr:MAG: hypothetical protein C3F02_02115 [Parcubacteria group bacterium]
MNKEGLKKYWWWLPLLLLVLFGNSRHILDSDEGVILSGAWNIINERQIYTDFFSFTTPGTYYAVAGLWKLLGVSYWSAKVLSALFVFFSAVGLYRLGRMFPGKFYFLPPIFFVAASFAWPIIGYYIYNVFFMVWATFYFCRALEKNSLKNLLLSGLLSALATLFLQSKGAVLVFVVITYLGALAIIKRETRYWRWAFLYGALSLILCLGLFFFWTPQILYHYLIDFPLFHYSAVISRTLYLWYFFLLLLAAAIFTAYRQADKKMWFLFYLQLTMLVLASVLPDWFHLCLSIFPLLALWPFFMGKIWSAPAGQKFFYSGGLLAIAFFMSLPSLLVLKTPPWRSVSQHPLFKAINMYCQDSPYIYAGAFIPGVYFETRKLNATAYDWLITNHQTNEDFLAARDSLAEKKPACVISSPLFVGQYGYDFNNPVDNYIPEHYRVVWSDSNFKLWRLVTD